MCMSMEANRKKEVDSKSTYLMVTVEDDTGCTPLVCYVLKKMYFARTSFELEISTITVTRFNQFTLQLFARNSSSISISYLSLASRTGLVVSNEQNVVSGSPCLKITSHDGASALAPGGFPVRPSPALDAVDGSLDNSQLIAVIIVLLIALWARLGRRNVDHIAFARIPIHKTRAV